MMTPEEKDQVKELTKEVRELSFQLSDHMIKNNYTAAQGTAVLLHARSELICKHLEK